VEYDDAFSFVLKRRTNNNNNLIISHGGR